MGYYIINFCGQQMCHKLDSVSFIYLFCHAKLIFFFFLFFLYGGTVHFVVVDSERLFN